MSRRADIVDVFQKWVSESHHSNDHLHTIGDVFQKSGFCFVVEGRKVQGSRSSLFNFGSEKVETFVVASARFVGVEGFPDQCKFRMKLAHLRWPQETCSSRNARMNNSSIDSYILPSEFVTGEPLLPIGH